MKFLVTGCAGFIGSHFVERALSENETNLVVGIDCMYPCSSPKAVRPRDRFVFIQGNINTENLVRNALLQYDIDVIVHFAAQSHVDTSFSDMRAHVRDNAVGTFNVLEAMREANVTLADKKKIRLIMVSTDEVTMFVCFFLKKKKWRLCEKQNIHIVVVGVWREQKRRAAYGNICPEADIDLFCLQSKCRDVLLRVHNFF